MHAFGEMQTPLTHERPAAHGCIGLHCDEVVQRPATQNWLTGHCASVMQPVVVGTQTARIASQVVPAGQVMPAAPQPETQAPFTQRRPWPQSIEVVHCAGGRHTFVFGSQTIPIGQGAPAQPPTQTPLTHERPGAQVFMPLTVQVGSGVRTQSAVAGSHTRPCGHGCIALH